MHNDEDDDMVYPCQHCEEPIGIEDWQFVDGRSRCPFCGEVNDTAED